MLLGVSEHSRLRRFTPSAVALGVSFLSPASYAVTIFVGAAAMALSARIRPQLTERHGHAVAAGAIAGESLTGVLIAVLIALHLLHG
jgi:uncharacterized oligopeptide transporter (OPT) family protein